MSVSGLQTKTCARGDTRCLSETSTPSSLCSDTIKHIRKRKVVILGDLAKIPILLFYSLFYLGATTTLVRVVNGTHTVKFWMLPVVSPQPVSCNLIGFSLWHDSPTSLDIWDASARHWQASWRASRLQHGSSYRPSHRALPHSLESFGIVMLWHKATKSCESLLRRKCDWQEREEGYWCLTILSLSSLSLWSHPRRGATQTLSDNNVGTQVSSQAWA